MAGCDRKALTMPEGLSESAPCKTGAARDGSPVSGAQLWSRPSVRMASPNVLTLPLAASTGTAPVALELYAEVFEAQGQLDRLEAFASFNGADFYGLPRNTETVTLTKTESSVPITRPFGDTEVRLLRGGETVAWSLA